MKKSFIFLLFVIIGSLDVYAQDILQLKDGGKIEVKLLEINETSIKYKRWDNLNGPSYTISITKVYSIIYENGTMDKFDIETIAKSDVATSIEQAGNQVSNSIDNSGNKISKGIDNSVLLRKNELKNQAHTLKVLGWIAGIAVIGGGVAVGLVTETYWMAGVCPAVGGVIIGLCTGIADNKEDVADRIQVSAVDINVNENLSLNVCHFNNRSEHTRALGVGMTMRF